MVWTAAPHGQVSSKSEAHALGALAAGISGSGDAGDVERLTPHQPIGPPERPQVDRSRGPTPDGLQIHPRSSVYRSQMDPKSSTQPAGLGGGWPGLPPVRCGLSVGQRHRQPAIAAPSFLCRRRRPRRWWRRRPESNPGRQCRRWRPRPSSSSSSPRIDVVSASDGFQTSPTSTLDGTQVDPRSPV